jgi:ABC transport system ATP-binding/permease protein
MGGVAKQAASAKSGGEGSAPPAPEEGSKRKLAYLEQREWDGMEAKILEAERGLATWHRELQEAASDAKRLTKAYEELQLAQRRVEALYARWAELEVKVAR